MTPFVEQLNTGKVKKIGTPDAKKSIDREWETGIFKESKEGEIWLSETGLVGDEVGDKKNHGGAEKALFAYPMKHYGYWNQVLPGVEMEVGGMGENLVLSGVDESVVCIGDVYQFGGAIIQVSQPRSPCWRPARRHKVIDLALRIQQTGLTGWYYRVLKEGKVSGNTALILLERSYPLWTIAKCNEVMYEKKDDFKLTKELADCPVLAKNWKRTLNRRLEGIESVLAKRVYGPNKDWE